jgi:hypothetical protein
MVAVVVLSGLLLATSSRAAERKYDTPQAVFSAAQAASTKDDWPALCRTPTPESRDALAGGLAATQVVLLDLLEGLPQSADAKVKAQARKKVDAMKQTLLKHKLKPAKIKTLLEASAAVQDPSVRTFPKIDIPMDRKTLLLLAEPIKDRDRFIADCLTAIKVLGAQGGGPAQLGKGSRLEKVTIDGDTATARVLVQISLGSEEGHPLTFRKIDGGWRVELPLQFE